MRVWYNLCLVEVSSRSVFVLSFCLSERLPPSSLSPQDGSGSRLDFLQWSCPYPLSHWTSTILCIEDIHLPPRLRVSCDRLLYQAVVPDGAADKQIADGQFNGWLLGAMLVVCRWRELCITSSREPPPRELSFWVAAPPSFRTLICNAQLEDGERSSVWEIDMMLLW